MYEGRALRKLYITAPSPCPYLPGRFERKLFAPLHENDARHLNEMLTHAGFRRSQNVVYRPACKRCKACVSVRVPVDRFRLTRGFRRVWKTNRDIAARLCPPRATTEQYSLFRHYVETRHNKGGMADMSMGDYAAMVEDSHVETALVEYRHGPNISLALTGGPAEGTLAAVALTDRLEDGLSMIYSFFDPDQARRSLGTYIILEHIARAKKMGLAYLYLGYWVSGSGKMDYKRRFLPQEHLAEDGWTLVER